MILALALGIASGSCKSDDDIPPDANPSSPEELSFTDLNSLCLGPVEIASEDGVSNYRLVFDDQVVRHLDGRAIYVGIFRDDDGDPIVTFKTYVGSGLGLEFAALSIYQVRLHFILKEPVGRISEGSYFVVLPRP